MPENSKSSSSSLLWFFRGLFGVKVLATWSPLVLEAMGDLKVGWVGSRFFCLAYKFSDSGVVSVEGGCDSSLGVEGVVGERSRGEVRRVLDDESLVSEKKATNCRPNWSERLYGCLHLILTRFHFLVAAALDSFSLPYVTDLVLFFPLLESGTVIRVDWGRRVMYSSESELAESPTNTSTNADPKLPGERRSSLSGENGLEMQVSQDWVQRRTACEAVDDTCTELRNTIIHQIRHQIRSRGHEEVTITQLQCCHKIYIKLDSRLCTCVSCLFFHNTKNWVDFMAIDLVRVDLVRIDLVTQSFRWHSVTLNSHGLSMRPLQTYLVQCLQFSFS